MTPDLVTTVFLCAACLFLGRIWERHDYCSGIGKAARAVLESREYAVVEALPCRLHPEQDVTGDLPPRPAVVRFGPPEPRWWQRHITNTRRAI